MNFYNDNDPKAAAWLRQLIADGLIPPGDVDERSIADIGGAELQRYTQCHFFAGIGGWEYALKINRWPADKPIWTGSCPCPPFSSAGKKKPCPKCQSQSPVPCPRRTGYFICCACEHAWFADARHLWPEFWRLIAICRPPVVYGEQVASDDGRVWLAGVRASLEILGYGVGASDLCAAGVGAPHLRQRLYWAGERLDNTDSARCDGAQFHSEGIARPEARLRLPDVGCPNSPMAEPESEGRTRVESECASGFDERTWIGGGSQTRGLGNPHDSRSQGRGLQPGGESGRGSPWSSGTRLILCTDGKTRRIKPEIFPLAHGFPGRVGLLRGSGNAIVPQVAAKFIQACGTPHMSLRSPGVISEVLE
jgi:DNA (cytosine-5)-methyltransferase 1